MGNAGAKDFAFGRFCVRDAGEDDDVDLDLAFLGVDLLAVDQEVDVDNGAFEYNVIAIAVSGFHGVDDFVEGGGAGEEVVGDKSAVHGKGSGLVGDGGHADEAILVFKIGLVELFDLNFDGEGRLGLLKRLEVFEDILVGKLGLFDIFLRVVGFQALYGLYGIVLAGCHGEFEGVFLGFRLEFLFPDIAAGHEDKGPFRNLKDDRSGDVFLGGFRGSWGHGRLRGYGRCYRGSGGEGGIGLLAFRNRGRGQACLGFHRLAAFGPLNRLGRLFHDDFALGGFFRDGHKIYRLLGDGFLAYRNLADGFFFRRILGLRILNSRLLGHRIFRSGLCGRGFCGGRLHGSGLFAFRGGYYFGFPAKIALLALIPGRLFQRGFFHNRLFIGRLGIHGLLVGRLRRSRLFIGRLGSGRFLIGGLGICRLLVRGLGIRGFLIGGLGIRGLLVRGLGIRRLFIRLLYLRVCLLHSRIFPDHFSFRCLGSQ